MFNRYLHRCVGLMDALLRLGYSPYNRRFTRQQVAIVFDYLGEP